MASSVISSKSERRAACSALRGRGSCGAKYSELLLPSASAWVGVTLSACWKSISSQSDSGLLSSRARLAGRQDLEPEKCCPGLADDMGWAVDRVGDGWIRRVHDH